MEFYDAAGSLITTVKNPVYEAGIGIVDGDRLLGIFHPGGIRRIRIVNDGTGNQGLEVDHLQYGDILPQGEGELAADAAIGELFPAQH